MTQRPDQMTVGTEANETTGRFVSRTAERFDSAAGRERGGEDGRPQGTSAGRILQQVGELGPAAVGLPEHVRRESVRILNQVLADTFTLRDLYKKHHWEVTGPNFYSLHLLFDKHYGEQASLIDEIGERIQGLGGLAVAMGHDVASLTRIPRPPSGRESAPDQIRRLLAAHEQILTQARESADQADEAGDDGTNDLLVSGVVRLNEAQAWFLQQHLM